MENSNNIIYWVAGFAAISIMGYVYYRIYKKKKALNFDDVKKTSLEIKYPINNITTCVSDPSFTSIIKYFKGQCNSFRMVANTPRNIDSCEKVFEYADKVIEFHGNDDIKNWWFSFAKDRNQWNIELYSDKAKRMITMIQKTGVTPSTEKILKWNEEASLHYMPFDEIEIDDICNVIQPCWIYQNEIFEQGLVSKKINK